MDKWKEIVPDEVPWKPAYMLASAPLSQQTAFSQQASIQSADSKQRTKDKLVVERSRNDL